jgi:RNA polymerase sigma-70 factor, ECF subfamily
MINAYIQAAYPQALSRLVSILGDIDQAEDGLQSAVELALTHWPQTLPDNQVAWLITVARNRFIDGQRRLNKQQSLDSFDGEYTIPSLTIEPDLSEQALLLSYNDDLLRLIFTSCHPALNPETQITLALKHVLGLSVEQIASALLINKSTLQQRLVRAKKKILANGIEYQVPLPKRWHERLSGVLKTIYLLFNEGYLTTDQTSFIGANLCKEAIRLCRLVHQCIRGEPEVIGLLALLLQQDARRPARVDSEGSMILLADQDRSLWKRTNILEANQLVEKALLAGRGTPYAIQAAIASLHNNAPTYQDTDWQQIYGLYQVLIHLEENPIIHLNAAIALANCGQREKAIQTIKSLHSQLANYRHYYTALAGIYFESGDLIKALPLYREALQKTDSKGERTFIKKQILICEA